MNNKFFEDKITKSIEAMIDNERMVGLSVCVVHKDSIIYSKGFGYSQLNPATKPMTTDTIMSIQSVTKNFMAVSIMQLVEQGRINVDSPLAEYLPYFKTKDKKASDKITVRQVLSHTAGFPADLGIANMIAPNVREIFSDTPDEFQEALDYYRLSEKEIKDIKSREDITRWFEKVELDYSPGEGWNYCTDAYVLLADLVEKVSGQKWEAHIKEYIYQKANMQRTTLTLEQPKMREKPWHSAVFR